MAAYVLKPCRDCASPRYRERDKGYGLRCMACGEIEREARNARRPRRNAERDVAVAEFVKAGATVRAMARQFGVSDARIRQIISRLGLKAAPAVVRKAASRPKRTPGQYLPKYGCLRSEAVALNDGLPIYTRKSKAYKFSQQRNSARLRGIAWEITFPEWVKVWAESGKLEQRGITADSYAMARFGDAGPYAVWNVSIITAAENARDAQAKRWPDRNRD